MEELGRRFASAQIAWLEDRYPRPLADNPAGWAVLAAAVERAFHAGFGAWCLVVGDPTGAASDVDSLWDSWQAQRDLTPEAERWPERLAERGDPTSRQALDAGAATLLAAGDELGLTAGVLGRRAAGVLRDVGRQATEAGAALRCALDAPPPSADELPDAPAPLSAQSEARTILATIQPDQAADPYPATRAVGLEHGPRRFAGKATAGLIVVGFTGVGATATLFSGTTALTAFAAYLIAALALVAWSERAASQSR